jgi:hypothetical protein
MESGIEDKGTEALIAERNHGRRCAAWYHNPINLVKKPNVTHSLKEQELEVVLHFLLDFLSGHQLQRDLLVLLLLELHLWVAPELQLAEFVLHDQPALDCFLFDPLHPYF